MYCPNSINASATLRHFFWQIPPELNKQQSTTERQQIHKGCKRSAASARKQFVAEMGATLPDFACWFNAVRFCCLQVLGNAAGFPPSFYRC